MRGRHDPDTYPIDPQGVFEVRIMRLMKVPALSKLSLHP